MEISHIIRLLQQQVKALDPAFTSSLKGNPNPYRVMISVLLSSRTKDEVTDTAVKRLFTLASTPKEMARLNNRKIAKAIYPVGFYNVKAKAIKQTSKSLISDFNSKVPDNIDDLLKLKGIGRKSANLIVAVAFKKKAVCVDTHVHRIFNRLGFVKTKTPYHTELALRKKLPKRFWLSFNHLFVKFGQLICKPVRPLCERCSVFGMCKRINAAKNRKQKTDDRKI